MLDEVDEQLQGLCMTLLSCEDGCFLLKGKESTYGSP
jgi:hypothetical protein